MSNKALKQQKGLREVWLNRMNELKTVAEDAMVDEGFHDQFNLRYADIETIAREFINAHLNITSQSAVSEGADLVEEEDIRKTFDNHYYRVKEIHLKVFDNKNQVKTDSELRLPSVKLPKIDLPKFNGNMKDWPSFFDLYKVLIHNNASLSKIEKFQYLVSSLTKNALTCVKSIPLTSDNYEIAFTTLISRFQNNRLLATAYWQEIADAPKLTSDSAYHLRNLLDCFKENLEGLKNINLPIDSWSFVLFQMLIKKLHPDLIKRFELKYASNDIPSYDILCAFLNTHCVALESANLNSMSRSCFSNSKKTTISSVYSSRDNSVSNRVALMTGTTSRNSCLLCSGSHSLKSCSEFLKKKPFERFKVAKQNILCLNCLEPSHRSINCSLPSGCKKCGSKHHDLLHYTHAANSNNVKINLSHSDSLNDSQAPSISSSSSISLGESNSQAIVSTLSLPPQVSGLSNWNNSISVLLATALVEVLNCQGHPKRVRVMLDSGSQASFITSQCSDILGLKRCGTSLKIKGLSGMSSDVQSKVNFDIRPIGKSCPIVKVDAFIIPKICDAMPTSVIPDRKWPHLSNIKLADPLFHIPHEVDVLLAADTLPSILLDGQMRGTWNEPMAINTIFGWVLTGRVSCEPSHSINSFFSNTDFDLLSSSIKKFWELENIPECQPLSEDEKLCEKIFVETFIRDLSGRYMVALPFKNGKPCLLENRSVTLRRLISLERRLQGDPKLFELYSSFMKDYLESGHMSYVCGPPRDPSQSYYIPHFSVVRPDSVSTKLRVVFDASAAPPGGESLNQTLLVGPKLQKDISQLLLSFRCHRFVFTADIKQMYRQILIHPEHRDYQRILWRFNVNEPVQEFKLNTVTYGISSSPYLANRVLLQLSEDEKSNFPTAAKVLSSDFYVDDLLTGCNSLEAAKSLQKELISLLSKGGFELRKWASNHPSLLENFPDDFRYHSSLSFNKDENFGVKILGLKWYPSSDVFSYNVDISFRASTKRNILSDIARIFDPLGFLAPVLFYAKYFMQYLWKLGLEWDQEPPEESISQWISFRNDIKNLSSLRIPRFFGFVDLSCQLHGFCDASERGYAAVVYIRSGCEDRINTSIVISKSKVAPLKVISIARLELCAAVLLADLIKFVVEAVGVKFVIEKIFCWSDSLVTLHWIKSEPYRWQTFVANRINCIQQKVDPSFWKYVPSKENPADCASRGLTPSELLQNTLWWAGPKWLRQKQEFWPEVVTDRLDSSTFGEAKKIVFATVTSLDWVSELLERYSSLSKILIIFSYILRFIHNVKNRGNKNYGSIVLQDLHHSKMFLIKMVQHSFFSEEIVCLKSKKILPKSFRKLSPFLDESGVIRVGGRLHHSSLPYAQKHPILIPQKHRLTYMIIQDCHTTNLHPGLQTLRYLLLQNYWIMNAKRAIRHVISGCNRCFRCKPIPLQPYMGNLPSLRVNQVKPFSVIGVDFGGPFSVTMSKNRGAKTYKSYICLFICFSTKAVHIELASELSTEAFLAALRRFIARRGRCSIIHSDCGTNFVGACKYIREIFKGAVEKEKIEFKFNCPSAPHFGGIWEAGIKSVKTHLTRVIGEQVLSFEELYTVLTQIEALLNSRPLCELSSDPNDLNALTPGHFLTLEPLTCIPDPVCSNKKINCLSRWQLLQRMHRDFWKRWHLEYLNTLQQRQKWTNNKANITIDKLVLIKNELQPPLRWRLGRVIKLHAGADGVNRVATLKVTSGILQRPLVKLCPLPSQ